LAENAHRAFGIKDVTVDTLPEDVAAFLRYGEGRRRRLLAQARKMWNEVLEQNLLEALRAL
jgi:hypothetical protein